MMWSISRDLFKGRNSFSFLNPGSGLNSLSCSIPEPTAGGALANVLWVSPGGALVFNPLKSNLLADVCGAPSASFRDRRRNDQLNGLEVLLLVAISSP